MTRTDPVRLALELAVLADVLPDLAETALLVLDHGTAAGLDPETLRSGLADSLAKIEAELDARELARQAELLPF